MKLSIDEDVVTVGKLTLLGAHEVAKRAKVWAMVDPSLKEAKVTRRSQASASVAIKFKTKEDARDFAIAFLYRGGVPR